MPDAILATIILTPLALTFFLKSNAALAYLALCGSFVLISFAGSDIKDLTGTLKLQIDSGTANLAILIFPFLLTLLLANKAFSGKGMFLAQLAAALLAGAFLALVGVPLLNEASRTDFSGSWTWENLQKAQTPVIVAGVSWSLLLVWFGGFKHAKKHKKSH